mgnify:CR=1 FL=1
MYTTPLRELLRTHNANYHLYADDTPLYMLFEVNQADNAMCPMEVTVHHIGSWMNNNLMKLNTYKTELLIISSKKQLDNLRDIKLKVGSDIISPSTSARNIGVNFDSTLSLVPHISTCVKSALFHLRNIGRIRKYLTQDATAQLVHSLVTSRLDYGNALLTNMPTCHLKKLQHIQNIAARVVSKTGRYEHITPILMTLHWLPVPARIDYKVAVLVYKALHDQAPKYIQDMLVPYLPSRQLRSSGTGLLQVPRFRTKQYGARSFSVFAPKLWNTLPVELRTCATLQSFTSQLKTFLFRKYYN